MIKVVDLITERNVLVINMFSKNGALGGSEKRSIKQLYESKNKIHNTTDNFLSASIVKLGQDRIDNIFKLFIGLLLMAGDIYYAKVGEKDIGYDPKNTTIQYLNDNPEIIKPNKIVDINDLLDPKGYGIYTELLICEPKFMGFVIINKTNSDVEYTYEDIYKFCADEKIPLFRLKYDGDFIFDELIQILPEEIRKY